MKLEESWIKMYGFAKRYYKKNHNLLVNTEYSIISHKEKIYLGSWISEQKKKYIDNALSYEQIELLENIGIKWHLSDKTTNEMSSLWNLRNWLERYEYAEKYYKKYGHLLIVDDYNVKLLSGKVVNLKNWINLQAQKKQKGELSQEEINMLERIGMKWVSLSERKWLYKYYIAESYYKIYGDLLVPNSLIYNEFPLGNWLQSQRESYKKGLLLPKRVGLLEKIGMIWEKDKNVNSEIKATFSDRTWLDMFWIAKKYYDKNGGFETLKLENNEELFSWILCQKTSYLKRKLSQNQIYLLEFINVISSKSKEKTKKKSIRGVKQ